MDGKTTTGPGTLPPSIGSTTKCDNFTRTGKCGGGGGKGGGGTKPKPTVICPEGSHLKDGKCTPCHYDNGVNGSQTCVYVEKKIIERHTSHYVGGSSSSSKSKGLTQIPSNATDFPGDDTGVIQVHVTSANKDIIGAWHVKGEITNVGNDTIQFVRVTVHFYDSSGGLIGDSSCCYTTPDSIEPHHTVTFDSFANKDEITATPRFVTEHGKSITTPSPEVGTTSTAFKPKISTVEEIEDAKYTHLSPSTTTNQVF
jgi:hypothetical protein